MSSVNAQPESPPEPKPPRSRSGLGSGYRDMIISMAVLLPIVAFVALLSRGCSFSPGGPTVDPAQMPSADAHATYTEAAHRLSFPIREPVLPAGWRASTVNQRLAPGNASAVRVSWITAGGRYVRLTQTTAEEGALVVDETGGGQPVAEGPVDVSGQQWVRYTGANSEQAWTKQADGVIWLITGDGVPSEFTVLAKAVESARPLPR